MSDYSELKAWIREEWGAYNSPYVLTQHGARMVAQLVRFFEDHEGADYKARLQVLAQEYRDLEADYEALEEKYRRMTGLVVRAQGALMEVEYEP